MKLNKKEIKYSALWDAAHIKLFKYDVDEMTIKTKKAPKWVHIRVIITQKVSAKAKILQNS